MDKPSFFRILPIIPHALLQAFYFLLFPVKREDAGFIDLALRKGATGVVTTKAVAMEKQAIFSHVTFFGVKDVRKALTQTAKFLFPQSPPFMAAVTGTNGKTSVCHYTQTLFKKLELKSMSIGTLGVKGVTVDYPLSKMTTLEPFELYPLLDEATQAGVRYCVMEASSHGLHQKRLDGCQFQAAVLQIFLKIT